VRFLLLLALFLHAGPVEGTQVEGDEVGTPNINTIIEWVRSGYPDLPRIQTTNCRRISGSSTWSQHSWANAADIFVDKKTGDELAARLRERYGPWIATLLWWRKDHWDHIHVDMWPEGIFTPPCAGGKLVVAYEDGTIGYKFTNDIKTGDEDMEFIIRVLKGQNSAFYRSLQAVTGEPGGDPAYWASDDPREPSDAEWADAAPKLFGAALQAGVFHTGGDVVAEDRSARTEAQRAHARLDALKGFDF
jgi:hypothetical protein